jgi:3-oxoacyl-[acyl-carrier protein] reductase
MHMILKGQAGIVTGASLGIGRAVAIALAAEGAGILVNYLKSEEAADEVVSGIESAGGKACKFRADVSRKVEVAEMAAFAEKTFGRIDFLVNNAGLLTRTFVEDMKEEEWDLVLDTNLKGTFFCCQSVIPFMKRQKGGRIVIISSGRGIGGQQKGAHYAASKAGQMGFAKSLSMELAAYGINVNSIVPGAIDTAHWRKGKSAEEIDKTLAEQQSKPNPLLKRVLLPEDVVGTVLFLLSDASKVMTGQTIMLRTP